MKTSVFPKMAAVVAVIVLAGAWSTGQAVVPPVNPSPPVAENAPAPNLPFGVPQIMKLAQAKVSDATIIAYIQNTGDSYNLDADQILWLRQQGVSDAVLTAMLSQPQAGVAPSLPAMPAPQPMVAPVYPGSYPEASAPYPADNSADYVQPYDYTEPYYYPAPFYWGGCYYAPGFYYGYYGHGGYRWGGRGYGYRGSYGGFRGGFRGGVSGFRGGAVSGGFRGGVVGGGFRGGVSHAAVGGGFHGGGAVGGHGGEGGRHR